MDNRALPEDDQPDGIRKSRAARRREMARTMSDVRSRLGTQDIRQTTFEHERQHLFAGTRINAAYAVPLLAVVVALIAVLWISPWLVGGWLVLTLCSHFLMVRLCQTYEHAEKDQKRKQAWGLRFAGADLLYGSSWALFFLMPQFQQTGEGVLVFLFAALLIVVAMNTMQSATLPRALLASTLPVTLTVAVIFLQRSDPIHYTLAAMAIGAQGVFLILGNQLLKNANTILEYRAEKDHLIAELETAGALSDESRRRAEAANVAKSRFLATMSHELRTPLNAILGFSEVMKDEVMGPMGNATYKSYSGDIHNSGQHLLNLINEILDLSRIEAGRHELQEEPLLLSEIADDCCTMMQVRAKTKDIAIYQDFAPDLAEVWADRRALRQVILNILSNAVKFTPLKGSVWITAQRAEDGGQVLTIKDTGPGIPEEEIPTVLEAFGQGSGAIKSAEPGTGLGLSIVQALIRMHDGRFALRSKLREGTEVEFTLPRSRIMQMDGEQRVPSTPYIAAGE